MAVKKEIETVEEQQIRDYELILIVNPEVAEERLDVIVNNVSQFITDRGGTVSDVARWGKRKLAYPIGHLLDGNYVLSRFKMLPKLTKELEANLRISEEIIRHLLIRIDS